MDPDRVDAQPPIEAEASGAAAHGAWPDRRAGQRLTVVKLAPDGTFVTEYPGEVVAIDAPDRWLAVRAVWTNKLVVLDGLAFHPGDTLIEFFSPAAWFNAFAVHAPDGALRGWYANVTYPTTFDPAPAPPRLTWHDLYVDVVARPDGTYSVLDEDELADSGVATTAPELHARIVAGRDAILGHLQARAFPFDRASGRPAAASP